MRRRILLIAIIMFNSACGNAFRSAALGSVINRAYTEPGEGTLQPSTDKLDAGCASSTAYDTCLFRKNPVAQAGGTVWLNQLELTRELGVKIRGVTRGATGLENARLRVLTLFTRRLDLTKPSLLKAPWSETESYVEQLAAYYWANLALDYLENRVGPLPLRGLKIYADDAFTGYVSATQSVHLEKSAVQIPRALSGEVVVQLVGQALAQSLAAGRLFPTDPAKHNACLQDPKGCCAGADGCAGALGNAFGDYFAAMIFPTSPRLGETLVNGVDGQSICGLRRDPAALKAKTKTEIFNACADKGRVVLLGAWYAARWWNLRTQLEAQTPGDGAKVDRLFVEHARAWSAASTFAEAKAEALRLAQDFEGGRLKAAFTAEFQAAGL